MTPIFFCMSMPECKNTTKNTQSSQPPYGCISSCKSYNLSILKQNLITKSQHISTYIKKFGVLKVLLHIKASNTIHHWTPYPNSRFQNIVTLEKIMVSLSHARIHICTNKTEEKKKNLIFHKE